MGSWKWGGTITDDGVNRYDDVESLLCYVAMAHCGDILCKGCRGMFEMCQLMLVMSN
jgi:hypothetical protein